MSDNWDFRRFHRTATGRRRFLVTASGMSAAFLAACSGSNNNGAKPTAGNSAAPAVPSAAATGGATPATGTRATTTPAAAAAPKRGGTLTQVMSSGEQPHQDPSLSASSLLHTSGSGLAYSRLVMVKADTPPGQVVLVGDVAQGWQQPNDTTYVFSLRQGVKWHNIAPVNGRELIADDIVYSIQRNIDNKVNASPLLGIDKMTAVDKYTVRFDLKKPDADFPAVIADAKNKIIAKEAVDVHGDLKDGPTIGTGPWVFNQWVPNSTIKFDRNPNYFIPAQPYVDKLEILRILDASTAEAAFRTKTVGVLGVRKEQKDSLQKAFPELQLQQIVSTSGAGLFVRWDKPPTDDIRVRQAISKLLDRQQFIDGVRGGEAVWTSGVQLPSLDWQLSDDELKKLLAVDVAGAKALASQAGFTSWNAQMYFYQDPDVQADAELAQPALKQLNIATTLAVADANTTTDTIYNRGEFQIALTLAAMQSSTNTDLYLRYYKDGARNPAKLNDPQLNQLIDAQAVAVQADQRKKLLQDLQRRVIELAATDPIYMNKQSTLIWPFVKNYYVPFVAGEYSQLQITWLDKG